MTNRLNKFVLPFRRHNKGGHRALKGLLSTKHDKCSDDTCRLQKFVSINANDESLVHILEHITLFIIDPDA